MYIDWLYSNKAIVSSLTSLINLVFWMTVASFGPKHRSISWHFASYASGFLIGSFGAELVYLLRSWRVLEWCWDEPKRPQRSIRHTYHAYVQTKNHTYHAWPSDTIHAKHTIHTEHTIHALQNMHNIHAICSIYIYILYTVFCRYTTFYMYQDYTILYFIIYTFSIYLLLSLFHC